MKTLDVWVCVNKNNKMMLFADEPRRDKKRGIWVSKYPFCNCIAYKEIFRLVQESGMGWQHDPEPIPLELD